MVVVLADLNAFFSRPTGGHSAGITPVATITGDLPANQSIRRPDLERILEYNGAAWLMRATKIPTPAGRALI
jgi:hypothetical protein